MNTPDEGAFGPPRAPATLPPNGEIRVLYHGGTARRFGVETLIRSFEKLRDSSPRVTLRVCGPGDDIPGLRGLAASAAPDQIEVLGPVPFDSIPRELEAAHIGVVPTLQDRFTELLLPVKLMEYVHAGLPVVASRLPGITSYFSGREVRLFDAGDPASLARAIEDVCADPTAARERAVRAAARLSAIAWEQQRTHYLEMIDRLVTPVITLTRPASLPEPAPVAKAA
jgi:glycosyltransferase involved in cell wall biosynthesis